MSNYKRFITYLFQYDKNDKLGNCGFAKVEQRQNQCRMELHISKCPGQLREIEVCLFARKGEKLPRIILGKLPVRGQRADGVFRFDTEAVAGGNYSFSQICGIVLLSAQGCLIASQWDDEAIDWGNLCLESEEEMSLETDRETELLKKAAESETMVSPEAPAADQAPILSEEPVIEEQTIEDQTVEEAPMHMQSASAWATENVGCPELAGCWADFRRDHVEICPFAGDCKVSAIRFDLRDFKRLPKQFWFIRSNSFLLHGYFNYGALLFGYFREEDRWFLGIPGIFQNQERVMASLFGFTEFRTQEPCRQKTGEFGYWYRYLN